MPDELQPKPALVVVLHGCGQTASGYDLGAGWSSLATRYGFALLMPEQQSSNNANGCFNWFNPEDTARDSGEACSIRQMITRMAGDVGIDPHRVFVTGISAGGAMTSVMLATYPEVFAGGAIIAGLPFGVATNVREALNAMFQSSSHPAGELGDLVRHASHHKGPWPKLSVWHGSADRQVNPANANEIVKQWLDVHQLPSAPRMRREPSTAIRTKSGGTRTAKPPSNPTPSPIWPMAPRWVSPTMTSDTAPRARFIEAGISSSYHIASFFGLTDWIGQPKEALKEAVKEASRPTPGPSGPPARAADLVTVLRPLTTLSRQAVPPRQPRSRNIDVGAVITRALTAAGLMKSGFCRLIGCRAGFRHLFSSDQGFIGTKRRAAGFLRI